MLSPIRGLHHVTATVDRPQADLDCYVTTLGLRLVKRTVNFDNAGVYHFYYGDEVGTPGTLLTTFPYGGQGVPVGVQGAGQVTATAVSVPGGALDAWRDRLHAAGFEAGSVAERFGEPVVAFRDPSGLLIELVATQDDSRAPWSGSDVPVEIAPRGLAAVTLSVRDPGPSVEFLAGVLGWEVVEEHGARTRLAVGGDAPGRRVEILHAPEAPEAVNGLGTVHHVAMAVDDEETQLGVRDELVARGVDVTPVKDRQYFKSIYFREPGGILYEVATIPPGFEVDEERDALGRALKLPPWEESRRERIEASLAEVTI